MTVTPLGRDQDCSLKNREPDVPALLVPGSWRLGKAAVVGLYFIFPGLCTLSLPCYEPKQDDKRFVNPQELYKPWLFALEFYCKQVHIIEIYEKIVFLTPASEDWREKRKSGLK
ncbi:hypothetical protein STEG23_022634 [Scotinomys teguina]